jgi:dolichol-phosphate mannosyltransferase
MTSRAVLDSAHVHIGRHWLRFMRFACVGGSGVVVNTLALYLTVTFLGWAHVPAAALAAELAVINNFVWNDGWTFRDSPKARPLWQRLLIFNGVSLIGIGISLTLLWMLTTATHVHYLLANLIGIGVATLWNYGMNTVATWRDREEIHATD